MCQLFDLDYLAITPVSAAGVGAGLITFRFRNSDELEPLTIVLQRAALERFREDIDSLLADNSVLSNRLTINRAKLERVIVAPEVLEQFGMFDYKYASESEQDDDDT